MSIFCSSSTTPIVSNQIYAVQENHQVKENKIPSNYFCEKKPTELLVRPHTGKICKHNISFWNLGYEKTCPISDCTNNEFFENKKLAREIKKFTNENRELCKNYMVTVKEASRRNWEIYNENTKG